MKILKAVILVILLFPIISKGQAENPIKSVRGTWINFAYQDERNKYMNPSGTDMTSPELWRLKIKELSEMGMEYIVIMYAANERKSYYPSTFMPPAYTAGRESPIDAVMNAADEHNLKVFMSTGWAVNQDDNILTQEILETQLKILRETAGIYSKHKSFYGWYYPCEGVIVPYLSQEHVNITNRLSVEARSLTPGAKIMVSPYGIRSVDFSERLFSAQISKLNVDIIAYQDEIGCVVEKLPLPKMKENFARLREMHNTNNIAFWANSEIFTWEKELNVRNSALIPAPLPRFLSQLAGHTKAGVDEIISFAVCGILDKPGSEFPLGHPIYAGSAYKDYMDWKSGKGRWNLLGATFLGNLKHEGISSKVTYGFAPAEQNSSGNLTDGLLGAETTYDKNWLGFDKNDLIATIDLGAVQKIKTLAARFLNFRPYEVFLPGSVRFSLSNDGYDFRELPVITFDNYTFDYYDCWIDVAKIDIDEEARFIRVFAVNTARKWIFADEVMVNPEY